MLHILGVNNLTNSNTKYRPENGYKFRKITGGCVRLLYLGKKRTSKSQKSEEKYRGPAYDMRYKQISPYCNLNGCQELHISHTLAFLP